MGATEKVRFGTGAIDTAVSRHTTDEDEARHKGLHMRERDRETERYREREQKDLLILQRIEALSRKRDFCRDSLCCKAST